MTRQDPACIPDDGPVCAYLGAFLHEDPGAILACTGKPGAISHVKTRVLFALHDGMVMPSDASGAQANAVVLAELKREFARTYCGGSHYQEILPVPSGGFDADSSHLEMLHRFAKNNPIYHSSSVQAISDIECTVYEGDIGTYWLDSTKHGLSCQPFYPTWLLSAYIMASYAWSLGCSRLVDVGSGDGRIAYCGGILGMESHSVEIDEGLVGLQSRLTESTGVEFGRTCTDAAALDYSKIIPGPAAFFIGGLPQMGGDMLARSVVDAVLQDDALAGSLFVLAGSHSRRALSSNAKDGGWAGLLDEHGLRVRGSISLPTAWTFDQQVDTPYIFAGLS